MPRAVEPVRAIGRLAPGGPQVGIAPAPDGYRLVFGLADGSWLSDPTTDRRERRAGLVAAAIAFYLGSVFDPPGELEATQADLAQLVGSLNGDTRDALDAIDDGGRRGAPAPAAAASRSGRDGNPARPIGAR